MVSRPLCGDLAKCKRCPALVQGRTQPVCWREPNSNPKVRIMVIGEGPGRDEDAEGKPFVGDCSDPLDALLEALRLSREDIYLTNAIKCFAPGWKSHTLEAQGEIETCRRTWLSQEIIAFTPQIIFTIGKTALKSVSVDTTDWPRKFVLKNLPWPLLLHFPHPSGRHPKNRKRYQNIANDPLIVQYRRLIDSLRNLS